MKKVFKTGYHYKMVYQSEPIIDGNVKMLSDNRKGGILLGYSIAEVKYITLLDRNIILSNLRFNRKKYFFRPLKRDWNKDAYRISKHLWGKKHHLLTRYWINVKESFKDIFSISTNDLKLLSQCKDKELLKNLNSLNENFIIEIKNKSK